MLSGFVLGRLKLSARLSRNDVSAVSCHEAQHKNQGMKDAGAVSCHEALKKKEDATAVFLQAKRVFKGHITSTQHCKGSQRMG